MECFTHSSAPSYMSTSTSALRVALLLGAGACTIATALWLRYYPSPIRQVAKDLLSAEGRAVLEHGLTALGLPLMLHMLLRFPAPIWLDSIWQSLMALATMIRSTSALSPRDAPHQATWHSRAWSAMKRLFHMLERRAGTIISVMYFGACVLFELYQAYVSVYGDNPRGYVQYGQLFADAVGAALAVRIAQPFARKHYAQPRRV